MTRDTQAISLHDVIGDGFVLLTGTDGEAWRAAAQVAAARYGVPVHTYSVGPHGDLVAPEDTFKRGFALAADGAVIIRPDGVLAWAATGAADDATGAVDDAMQQLLCRLG